MYDSPTSLLELCLDCICERHASIFSSCYVQAAPSRAHKFRPQAVAPSDGLQPTSIPADVSSTTSTNLTPPPPTTSTQSQSSPQSTDAPDLIERREIFTFPDADFFLANKLSEKLLEKFDEKDLLTDSTLSIFRGSNTRLRNVRMRNAKVTLDGLAVLREHQLSALSCANIENVTVGGILHCLSAATLANLTHLDVSRATFIDISRHSMMVHLTHLKRLRSLNAAFTEFNQQTLQMICEDLPDLESLDLSGTWVQCLKPLLLIRHRLRSLVVSDLRCINQMSATIIELDALRHLDVSLIHERCDIAQNAAIADIFEHPHKLPALVSLDISGWRDLIDVDTMLRYLRAHPQLSFLGLVLNPVAFEQCLAEPTTDVARVHVAGLGNEAQIMCALRLYTSRYLYMTKALFHLFQLTDTFVSPREDFFKLVVRAMREHPKRFGTQMAATACLYNLTRGEMAKQIHPRHLSDAVHLTLDAMERFADEYQLQKNGLLTLCSDRILQEVGFDRYRCARVVLDALCTFEDVHMNRMSVAICSILAAKISTTQTSELGARVAYMRKLLLMVKLRVESKRADVTLKFTLSALWNLTDESAPTCAVFLEYGGAELFLEVLRVFRTEEAVETKVLGLLNNIAEVRTLRAQLLCAPLVLELRTLLAYDMIDVSYFAAGIVAHLAVDGESAWSCVGEIVTRDEMLDELEAAVSGWGVPENEMVSYRSFKPFFPLLAEGVDRRVQLWAVWAVHHVCTKNAERYCRMLEEQRGVGFLEALVRSPDCHRLAVDKCKEVLKQLGAQVR